MYVAMNRFQVALGQEAAFEELWRNRDSHLKDVDGFVDFSILRGAEAADHTLYISHSIWQDEASFRGWTKSEAFRQAHKGVGGNKDLYLGPPHFEGFAKVDNIA